MRVLIAIVAGLIIFGFGFGSMRGLARPRTGGSAEGPPPLDPRTRLLYWCENCGAEIVVAQQGNGHPFRHCGETMIKREEILREMN